MRTVGLLNDHPAGVAGPYLSDRAVFYLADSPVARWSDLIAARYGMDPWDVANEPDPRKRAFRLGAFLSQQRGSGG